MINASTAILDTIGWNYYCINSTRGVESETELLITWYCRPEGCDTCSDTKIPHYRNPMLLHVSVSSGRELFLYPV